MATDVPLHTRQLVHEIYGLTTVRIRVAGGWLYQVVARRDDDDRFITSVAQTFVPDPAPEG